MTEHSGTAHFIYLWLNAELFKQTIDVAGLHLTVPVVQASCTPGHQLIRIYFYVKNTNTSQT